MCKWLTDDDTKERRPKMRTRAAFIQTCRDTVLPVCNSVLNESRQPTIHRTTTSTGLVSQASICIFGRSEFTTFHCTSTKCSRRYDLPYSLLAPHHRLECMRLLRIKRLDINRVPRRRSLTTGSQSTNTIQGNYPVPAYSDRKTLTAMAQTPFKIVRSCATRKVKSSTRGFEGAKTRLPRSTARIGSLGALLSWNRLRPQ